MTADNAIEESTPTPKSVIANPQPQTVVVHPLVLLSVVDHYSRSAKNTRKRVLGILLGQHATKANQYTVNVANSFAVPFDEDEKDPSIWFLDHNYLESMFEMFKSINASEKVVGWYHSGPKLRSSDLEINELIKRYTPNPVLVVIDSEPKAIGLPTDAYIAVEEIHDDGTATTKTFNHLSSEIRAEEAEEIGVEHLLRDVKDNAVGTLSQQVTTQLHSIKGLKQRLTDIENYLGKVVSGEFPVNHPIMYNIQSILNMLPNLEPEEIIRAFSIKTNDQFLVVYLSSLIRAVIALHNLIDNKLENKEEEAKQEESSKSKEAKEEKDKKDDEKAAPTSK